MANYFKAGKKSLFLMIISFVFLGLSFWVLNAPKAEAVCLVPSMGCKDDSGCYFDVGDGLISNHSVCIIGDVTESDNYTWDSSCFAGTASCKQDACLDNAASSGANCKVMINKGGGSCDTSGNYYFTNGKWDASVKKCFSCGSYTVGSVTQYNSELAVCGTTSAINISATDGTCTSIGSLLFRQLCGATPQCEGKNFGFNDDCTISGNPGKCNAYGTCVASALPVLSVAAAPPGPIAANTPIDISFSVASGGYSIDGALVTLTGVATGTCTTNSSGSCPGPGININAPTGTITATATKTGYTPGTTTITVIDSNIKWQCSGGTVMNCADNSDIANCVTLTGDLCGVNKTWNCNSNCGASACTKECNLITGNNCSTKYTACGCACVDTPINPPLYIFANLTTLDSGVLETVQFTVSSSSDSSDMAKRIQSATITLSGGATGTCTTDSFGLCSKDITATAPVTATAHKTGYTDASLTLTITGSSNPVITVHISPANAGWVVVLNNNSGVSTTVTTVTPITFVSGEHGTFTATAYAGYTFSKFCSDSALTSCVPLNPNPWGPITITVPGDVYAAFTGGETTTSTSNRCPSGGMYTSPLLKGYCTFPQLIAAAINWILGLVSGIIILILIFGGISYVTSAGDESKITAAKNTILYAVIGLAIILLAYTMIQEVKSILKIV